MAVRVRFDVKDVASVVRRLNTRYGRAGMIDLQWNGTSVHYVMRTVWKAVCRVRCPAGVDLSLDVISLCNDDLI